MDPQRFDSIVQTLGTASSRRRALAALLTGVIAPLVPGTAAEADRRKSKGRGKGRGKNNHKGHGKGRNRHRGKANEQKKQPAKTGPEEVAADAPDCRKAGHPCEGNQTCCNRDRVICVSSGPGEAARCTPCPEGHIACANACIPACTASDQCHVAGECDPRTGACTDPPAEDGTRCDDNDHCTVGDVCQSGVCAGTPKDCSRESDPCNDGVCQASDGACVKQPKANGTSCNADNDSCTVGDSCQNGVCTPGAGVNCHHLDDECHTGVCDPSNGECVQRQKDNGTACNDGNACTTGEVCRDGECVGNPVTCTASDQCHEAGVCNPATGACDYAPMADGTPCDAGSVCTEGDVCQGGLCVPGSPVVCPGSACQTSGVCDPGTGTCLYVPAPDGTECGPFPGSCPPGSVTCSSEQCFNGSCEVCAGGGFYCDGINGAESHCCAGNGTCQPSIWDLAEGRRRCCYPDGTPCRSNEVFAHLACCGGRCNTASGTCSSTCTPVGGPCRHPFECCGVVTDCIGFGPGGIGHCV